MFRVILSLKLPVDGEMRGFDLTTGNHFLKSKVPLTFTKGKLDLYAEAQSTNGTIEGYIKPFLKNIDVVKTKEDFKGPKNWFYEIVTAVGKLGLRASDTKSDKSHYMGRSGIPFSSREGIIRISTETCQNEKCCT